MSAFLQFQLKHYTNTNSVLLCVRSTTAFRIGAWLAGFVH